MPIHRFRGALALLLLLIVVVSAPAARARADGVQSPGADLPTLDAFVLQVMNGDSAQLRGVYAPDLFAFGVTTQPEGYPEFISRDADVLTQFGSASQVGSIGLLAHNYLAGRQFPLMEAGQLIHLVYGDGLLQTYTVAQSLRYRALQPRSASSEFVDLVSGGQLAASALFQAIYGRPGAVVFQTCIAADGVSTWGRLFVVAIPREYRGFSRHLCETCE